MTMPRVLEPEVMDGPADAEAYDAMDFSESDGRFADDAVALLRGRSRARVLDVGTGTAKIPILMLRRAPSLSLVAVDMSEAMLAVARRQVTAAGFADRVTLAPIDAKALSFENGSFDMVLCNSVVHHVPDPRVAFAEIARVVRRGGAVLVRDLIRPASEREAWALVDRAAAGAAPRQRQLFFDSLRAALTVDEVKACVGEAGLADLEVARVSDRHWTAERPLFFGTEPR